MPMDQFIAERIERAENARLSSLTASAAKPASRKRKSTEAGFPDLSSVDLEDIIVEDMPMTENCDQIRRKINRLLDSGAMTKTKFAGVIGVSTKSLSGFLGESGPFKGSGYAAYDGAWEYFKKLEVAGIKIPVKKAKTTPSAGATTSAAATSASGSNSAGIDISDVHLPGEEEDNVPVYDTCDEVRRKVNAHLKKPGVTQAQFGRDILAQIHLDRPASFQGSQIARFRGMKGPRTGATQAIFYGAYVFFEKIRIKEGKPKTKHREEMEKAWPGGFDRRHDPRRG